MARSHKNPILDAGDRVLLTEAFRPPDGFEFSCAIGTTYTLELTALLLLPLACSVFAYEEGDLAKDGGGPTLLEAARSHASRIHLFAHAGATKPPKAHEPLFSYLEDCVISVTPRHEGAVFHPKLWVIRYTNVDEELRYRLLCLSRNLTHDRSWDTAVVLEGEPTPRGGGAPESQPLIDLLKALPRLATTGRGVPAGARNDIKLICGELEKVRFAPPPPFVEARFHPIGIAGYKDPIDRIDELILISPFLGEDRLLELHDLCYYDDGALIVSRHESLEALDPELRDRFELRAWTDALELEDDDGVTEDDRDHALSDLHAKLYVCKAGHHVRVFTGSANATAASVRGNVEFLVELVGGRTKCGMDRFRTSIEELSRVWEGGEEQAERDEDLRRAERLAQSAIDGLVKLDLRAALRLAEGHEEHSVSAEYTTSLRLGSKSSWPKLSDVAITCRQLAAPDSKSTPIDGTGPKGLIAEFGPHRIDLASSFFVFRAEARVKRKSAVAESVLNLPLDGLPDNRDSLLLLSMLKGQPDLLLRLLLLLLSDGASDGEITELITRTGDTGDTATNGWAMPPLLETMLRALHRHPDQLDRVHRLLEDIHRAGDEDGLLPEGFDQVWKPIWEARRRLADA